MTDQKRVLALLGASGHGKVIADAALAAGWESVIFFDDRWPTLGSNGRWKVVGDTRMLLSCDCEFDAAVVSIGHSRTRLRKQVELQAAGIAIATIIHPRACVSVFASLGKGSVVMAGAVINVDVQVGPASIINTGATVDHDCVLAAGVHVSPGTHLSGNVTVGTCTWIGVGASVKQGIKIGADAIVGAGAVVVKPVDDDTTVVGIPATLLPRSAGAQVRSLDHLSGNVAIGAGAYIDVGSSVRQGIQIGADAIVEARTDTAETVVNGRDAVVGAPAVQLPRSAGKPSRKSR